MRIFNGGSRLAGSPAYVPLRFSFHIGDGAEVQWELIGDSLQPPFKFCGCAIAFYSHMCENMLSLHNSASREPSSYRFHFAPVFIDWPHQLLEPFQLQYDEIPCYSLLCRYPLLRTSSSPRPAQFYLPQDAV